MNLPGRVAMVATVAPLVCAVSHAGDPIDDLVNAVERARTITLDEGATTLTFDSVVDGGLWVKEIASRVYDSDYTDLSAPQDLGLRGVLAVGAWEFTFAPTCWVTPEEATALATAEPGVPVVDVDRWRINGGVGWHLTNTLELRTQYTYTKDANSPLDGEHRFDFGASFSF